MFIKGVAKEASELALGLILEGFSYDDLRKIVIQKTNYKSNAQINYFEDKLYEKIERYSKYIWVKDVKTGNEYYYNTVKEMSLDTGISLGSINGSIYNFHLSNKMFKVEKRCFTSKELCRNKKHLFKNKIGKVKVI